MSLSLLLRLLKHEMAEAEKATWAEFNITRYRGSMDDETNIKGIQAYAIINAAGEVKTRSGSNRGRVGTLYLSLAGAKAAARAPGDSVVALVVPKARPLFIRGSKA